MESNIRSLRNYIDEGCFILGSIFCCCSSCNDFFWTVKIHCCFYLGIGFWIRILDLDNGFWIFPAFNR